MKRLDRKVQNIFKLVILLTILFVVVFKPFNNNDEVSIYEDGYYTSKNEVMAYLIKYEQLPNNYITKAEAAELGYEASLKNLWEVSDKKSIGGDRFFNREGLLPESDNRLYYECDIDFDGIDRGAKRIVYSNDGLIYYTDDHYDSFEKLVGD